jgi:hypothetical protein
MPTVFIAMMSAYNFFVSKLEKAVNESIKMPPEYIYNVDNVFIYGNGAVIIYSLDQKTKELIDNKCPGIYRIFRDLPSEKSSYVKKYNILRKTGNFPQMDRIWEIHLNPNTPINNGG